MSSASPHLRTHFATSRLRRWSTAAAAAAVVSSALVAGPAPVSATETTTSIHVAIDGVDSGSGAAHDPVRTIRHAIRLAEPGDTVVVHSGTYHEQVQVYEKQVHLTAAAGESVVLDGAVDVTQWTNSGGDWWASWQSDFARASAPHVLPTEPEAGWPEQFFYDDSQLVEVTSRDAVVPGTFYNDRSADRVWIGSDPTHADVAGSELPWAIYLNRAHGSSVSGFVVQRYATPTSDMAAVRAYADDLDLSDLVVRDNAYMGVSVIGADVSIDRVAAISNGHLGMHAHHSADVTIRNATVVGNNAAGFDAHHAAGGIKVTTSSNLTVSDSTVVDNAGPGIWTDLDATGILLTNNMVRGNSRSGIEIELSSNALIAGNTVIDNGEAGVWVLESSQVEIWHNALFGNYRDVWAEDGPRSDVRDVTINNNTLGGSAPGAPAVLNVDDWTEDRSAAEMNISADFNSFWLPERPAATTTTLLSRWANWPEPLALSEGLEAHRAATGQDAHSSISRAADNPFARDVSDFDFRQLPGAPVAAPVPAHVAAVLDVAPETAHPAGPIGATSGPSEPPVVIPPTTTPVTPTPTTPTPPGTVAPPPSVPAPTPTPTSTVGDGGPTDPRAPSPEPAPSSGIVTSAVGGTAVGDTADGGRGTDSPMAQRGIMRSSVDVGTGMLTGVII